MAYARYPDPLLLHVLYKLIWLQACVCKDPGLHFQVTCMHQVPECYSGLICMHRRCAMQNSTVAGIISLTPDEGHKAKV